MEEWVGCDGVRVHFAGERRGQNVTVFGNRLLERRED